MSKKVMGQQRTLLLILNTWRNTSFILKHLDVLHLIRSSEQPLLREGISMRNTYTFMRKMYGKLPLGSFLVSKSWFPSHLVLLYFSMQGRTSKADLVFLSSMFQPQSLKDTNTSQTSNYLCMASTSIVVVKWCCLKGSFGKRPHRNKRISTQNFFLETEIKKPVNNF